MKKKALKSKRNRHTGRVNEFKRRVIAYATEQGNKIVTSSDGSRYAYAYMRQSLGRPVNGLCMVRVN